jgi:hypothetical protein
MKAIIDSQQKIKTRRIGRRDLLRQNVLDVNELSKGTQAISSGRFWTRTRIED